MRPEETRVWRKTGRRTGRGVPRGRRLTHKAEIEAPQRGSTWLLRHPGPEALAYYLAVVKGGSRSPETCAMMLTFSQNSPKGRGKPLPRRLEGALTCVGLDGLEPSASSLSGMPG